MNYSTDKRWRQFEMMPNIWMKKPILVVILLALALATVPSGYTQIVAKDLVSYWSFDPGKMQGKKVLDGIGKHNGNIQGAVKSVKGKIGQALEFDGDKANFVQFDGAKDVDFSKDFTWMCWIKTSDKGVIFAKTGAPGSDAKGPKTWWISDKVLSFDVGWVGNVKDAEAHPADGKWHHVAIAAEGKSGNLQYYVDGEATGKGAMAGINKFPEDSFKQRLKLGQDGRCDGHFGYFKGLIDEFAVYTRLLDANEVKQNAKSARGLAVEPGDKLSLKWSELKVR